MTFSIYAGGHGPYAGGHGPAEDDLRAAFGDLVRALRDATPEGQDVSASLSTGTATYIESDVPDEDPADVAIDEEDPQP